MQRKGVPLRKASSSAAAGLTPESATRAAAEVEQSLMNVRRVFSPMIALSSTSWINHWSSVRAQSSDAPRILSLLPNEVKQFASLTSQSRQAYFCRAFEHRSRSPRVELCISREYDTDWRRNSSIVALSSRIRNGSARENLTPWRVRSA